MELHPTRAESDPEAGSPAAAHLWVFDVDGCLIDSLTGSSLRPGARELLEHLDRNDRRVVLWSAGGAAYARDRARQFSVDGLVWKCLGKDERDGDGCYRTDHLPLDAGPAVFIDDRPEDLSPRLEVLPVPPYLSDDPHDRGFQRVALRAGLLPRNELETTVSERRD